MRLFLFTATIFLSASLLFVVEPMVGKMILPLLGGTPAVWNTCLVFFQIMLLIGYAYAHVMTRALRPRGQVILHTIVLASAVICLPLAIHMRTNPPTHTNPIGWLLIVLTMSIGLPFAIVSATAPLVQKWFVRDANENDDPYFLYAASNVGSMIALLSYPVLIEPWLALPQQKFAWTIGYGIFAAMLVFCGITIFFNAARHPERYSAKDLTVTAMPDPSPNTAQDDTSARSINSRSRIWWLILSAVPSSYLIGVTTYLTTDIAAVPLLWVAPLALYLLSFALAFGRHPPSLKLLAIMLPIAMVCMAVAMVSDVVSPIPLLIGVHLFAFFIASLVCNCRLAQSRPSHEHLTEFYLLISIGGVIGGLFNVLLAPLIFTNPAEYPIAVTLACMLLPSRERVQKSRTNSIDFVCALLAGAMTFGLFHLITGRVTSPPIYVLCAAIPLLFCFALRKRPMRFGLSIGAVLFAMMLDFSAGGKLLEAHRSFFGIHRVVRTNSPAMNVLYHGSTVHGKQHVDAVSFTPSDPQTPLTYYTRSGPIGQVMKVLTARSMPAREIAVVGLGAGSIAAYANAGMHLTFYEIDELVAQLAERSGRFSFISAARDRGAVISIVLGDARLTLQEAPPKKYDLLVLDAFSGDSIPIHLLTREALSIYQSKINDDGLIAFHISNLFLDLEPVLANLARDAGLKCLVCRDLRALAGDADAGKLASVWVVMARSDSAISALENDPRWQKLPGDDRAKLWTDDYSNIFSVLRR